MAAMQQQHKSHLTLLPIFLLLTAGRVVAVAGRASSVIRSTCAAVARSEVSTPYPYCLQTLSANQAAASAMDARGLATAAAELTLANVTRTIDVIKELMGGLQGCLFTYQAMQGSVAGALDDLRAGRLRPAWSKLRVASWQPDYCDLDLIQINKDPLMDENHDNHWVSLLASNIAGLIAAASPAPAPPPRPESR